MMKLLIVDDEKNIRNGLKVMIERNYPSTYNIVLAGNGAEALKLFRSEPVDIIITDIRMPVMDGMELLEQLSLDTDVDNRPEIVILSGYDDFQYAKSAIRYRVKEYLLKPIRRDELFKILEQINQEMMERDSSIRKSEQEMEAFLHKLRSGRIQSLLIQEEVQLESEHEDELKGFVVPFTIGVLNYHYNDGKRMKSGELRVIAERLVGPLEKKFTEVITDWDGKLVLFGSNKQCFTELAHRAEFKELTGLLIGISSAGNTMNDIRGCYKEACRALQYSILYSRANLIDYDDVKQGRLSFPSPDEEIRKLLNMLGTEREKEMKNLLAVIFQIEHLKLLDLSYLEAVGRSINERVLDEVFRVHGESSVEVLKLYRQVGSMYNFRHFHDYYRALEHLLISVNDYIIGVRSAHTEHADMKEALAYIEANYQRPINMAMVSNHVSLSYSYFSEAFKANIGESFVLYLKKVRIRHAKELLTTTQCKLAEVSATVGFENCKQFTRVFKELEGITPGEFRAKAQQ